MSRLEASGDGLGGESAWVAVRWTVGPAMIEDRWEAAWVWVEPGILVVYAPTPGRSVLIRAGEPGVSLFVERDRISLVVVESLEVSVQFREPDAERVARVLRGDGATN